MSKPRLLFLYPQFFRQAQRPRPGPKSLDQSQRHISASTPRRRPPPETSTQRYGTANEPPPPMPGGKSADTKENKVTPALPKPERKEEKQEVKAEAQTKTTATPQVKERKDTSSEAAKKAQRNQAKEEEWKAVVKDAQEKVAAGRVAKSEKAAKASQEPGSSSIPQAVTATAVLQEKPQSLKDAEESSPQALQSLLHMDSPSAEKPPHLVAPRHVHHFDTYSMTKALEEGKWSEEQAITVMKAMRVVLADNMDLARDAILSKGDSEMTTYLFRAACTELRTEIKNNRETRSESLRTERGQLQHEVDVTSQRITSETGTLKDELKGMFDDRKMATRMERRDIENRIQELNYRITARLNSEMKSEVEGLRWILVRRTAIAIVAVAVMVLLSLRASAYNNEKEKKRADAVGYPVPDMVTGGGGGSVPKNLEGNDPSLVSLG